MKKNILYVLIMIISFGCTMNGENERGDTVAKIIFDTDMGPDYDDVGAITVLHALAANNECEILACCASDSYPLIAPTIEVYNQYFGKPKIPIGVPSEDAPDYTCPNHWNDSIVAKYLSVSKTNNDYSSAVEVYRKTLAAQADKSVTIVTVGFLSNLDLLLKSGPDKFSSLSGLNLIKKKVKILVTMAGEFPEGKEFNVLKHPEASYNVFKNWPTPILFSGFEVGNEIYTGRKLAENGSKDSPVAWAYRYNLDTFLGKKMEKRNSWDQTAVLCAIRNPEKYFYVNGPGKFIIYEDGRNSWNPDIDAGHYFLTHKYPCQYIADIIDELMLFEPAK